MVIVVAMCVCLSLAVVVAPNRSQGEFIDVFHDNVQIITTNSRNPRRRSELAEMTNYASSGKFIAWHAVYNVLYRKTAYSVSKVI